MTTNKLFRPQTNASRLWVASGELWPPFCNQMIIEGDGSIELSELRRAVEEASSLNPGSRLILKNSLLHERWIDSEETPPVRVVDGSAWSGYNMNGAPFLGDRLDIRSGPSCEVLLVTGSKFRICFRTHHAVMDGRGTSTWAEDVFRVLRDEKPAGSEYTTTENELLNLQKKSQNEAPERYILPLENPGEGKGFTWFRKKITGRFRELLPSVMMLAASEAWRYSDGKVRIAIPIDLRNRKEGLRSTANLTNAIFFNIDKNTTPAELGNQIKRRIHDRIDGILTWEDHILKFVPGFILKSALSREAASTRQTGLYRISAVISNMGRIPLENFTTPAFNPESIFFVPPGNELAPVFIGIHGTDTGIEIFLTVPAGHDICNRAEEFLERLSAGLKSQCVET